MLACMDHGVVAINAIALHAATRVDLGAAGLLLRDDDGIAPPIQSGSMPATFAISCQIAKSLRTR